MADKCVACGEVAEGKPLYKKLGSSDCQVEVFTALHEMQLLSLPPEEKNNHYICWDCDETIAEEYSTFISTEAKKKAVEAKRKQQDEACKIKLQKKLKQAFKKAHDDALKANGVAPPVSKYKMREKEREENRYHASYCLLCKSAFEASKARGYQRFTLQKMVDDECDIADVLQKLGLKVDITEEMKRKRFVCCQCYNKMRRNYKALSRGEVASPLPHQFQEASSLTPQFQENNDQLNAFKRRPTAEEHAAEIAKLIPPSLANVYKVVTNEDSLEHAQSKNKSKIDISSQRDRKSERTRKRNPKYSSSDNYSSDSESDFSKSDTDNRPNLENGMTNHKSVPRYGLKDQKRKENEILKKKLVIKNGVETSRLESPKTPTIRTLLPKGANEFGSYDSDVCTPVSFTSGDSEIIDFGICNLCGLGYNSRPKDFWYKLSHFMPSVMGVTVLNALQILDSELADVSQSVREKGLVCKPCFSRVCKGFRSQILRRIAEKKGIDVTTLELSKINVKMVNQECKIDVSEDQQLLNGALNNNNNNDRNKNVNGEPEVEKKRKNVARSSSKSLAMKKKQLSRLNGNMEESQNSSELNNEGKEKARERSPQRKNYPKGEKIYKFKRCAKTFKKTLAALQSDFELINLINESRHLRYKGKVVLLNSVTVDLADLQGILCKSILVNCEGVRLELYKDLYQFSNFRRNLKTKKEWECCILCQKECLTTDKTTRWLEDPVAPPNLMVPLRWAHLSIAEVDPDSKINFATDDGKVCESCHDTLKNKFGKFVGSRVASSHGLSSEKIVLEKYKVSFDSVAMNIVADPLKSSPIKESRKKTKEKSMDEELGVEKLPPKEREKYIEEAKDAANETVNNGNENDNLKKLFDKRVNNSDHSNKLSLLGNKNPSDARIDEAKMVNTHVDGVLSQTESSSEKNRLNGELSNIHKEVLNAEANLSEKLNNLQDDGYNKDQDTLAMDLDLSDTSSEADGSDIENNSDKISEKVEENSDTSKAIETNSNISKESEEHSMSTEMVAETSSTNVGSVYEENKMQIIDPDKPNIESDLKSVCISDMSQASIPLITKESINDVNKTAEADHQSSASKCISLSSENASETCLQGERLPNSIDSSHSESQDDKINSSSPITSEKGIFPSQTKTKVNDNPDDEHSAVLGDTNNQDMQGLVICTQDMEDESETSTDNKNLEGKKQNGKKSMKDELLPKKRKSSETTFTDESICKKKCLELNESLDHNEQTDKGRQNSVVIECQTREDILEENGLKTIQSSSDHNDNSKNSESNKNTSSSTDKPDENVVTSTDNKPSQQKLTNHNFDKEEEETKAISTPREETSPTVVSSETNQQTKITSGKRKSLSDLFCSDIEPTLSSFPDSFMISINEEEDEFGEDNVAPFAQRKKIKGRNRTIENQQIMEKEALQSCLEEIWLTIQSISLDDLICEVNDFPLKLSQYNVGFLLALNDLRVHLGASLEDLIIWVNKLLPIELREKGLKPSMEKVSMYLLSLNNSSDFSSNILKQALPEELFHLPKNYHTMANQDKRCISKCFLEDVMEPSRSSNIKWEDFLTPVNLDNLLAGKPSRVSWSNFNNGLLYALWKVNKIINESDENFVKWLSLVSTTVMKERDYIAMSKAVIAIDSHLQTYPEEINRLVAPIVVKSGTANRTDDLCTADGSGQDKMKGKDATKQDGTGVVLEKVSIPNITIMKNDNSTIPQTLDSTKGLSTKRLARVLPQPSTDNINDGPMNNKVQINNGLSCSSHDKKSNSELVGTEVSFPRIGSSNSAPSGSNGQPGIMYNKPIQEVDQSLCSDMGTNSMVNSISYKTGVNRQQNSSIVNHPAQIMAQHPNSSQLAPGSETFSADPNMQYRNNPPVPIPVVAIQPTFSPVPTSIPSGVPLVPILNPNGYMTMVPLSVRMPQANVPTELRPRLSNVMPISIQNNQTPIHLSPRVLPSPLVFSPQFTSTPSFKANPTENEKELASKVINLERQMQEIQKQNSQLIEMHQKLLKEKSKSDTEKDEPDQPNELALSKPKISPPPESTSSSTSRQHKYKKSSKRGRPTGNKNSKPSFEDALNYKYKS